MSEKRISADTNMVFFTDLSNRFKEIIPFFEKERILLSRWSDDTLRIVFHLDIDDDALSRLIEVFKKFYDPVIGSYN